jgi:holliday junction DNA helicase RuvA
MIAQLRGKVIEKELDTVIIEAGGIGYEVAVTAADYGSLTVGEEAKLYTLDYIREDTHALYGFSNGPSKRFFQQLLGINGVGPKVALGVLSAASLPQLQQAIAGGDADVFKGVSGVGKKTAERIMVELRGKVEVVGDTSGFGAAAHGTTDPAYQALLGLGYTANQAAEAVAQIPADVTDEQARVKAALKQLG